MDVTNQTRRWDYSLWMLVTYVSVFVLWRAVPTRIAYVSIGLVAVIGLALGLRRAVMQRYFVNRVDLSAHVLVIADLLLETFAFEVFRFFQPTAVASQFHDNNNFFGCSLAFALIIGVHRWMAMNFGGKPFVGGLLGRVKSP